MALTTACATEYVELLPDDGPARAEAGLADADLSTEADLKPDQSPDQGPSSVCRFIDCRVTSDCQTYISPSSQCVGTVCTGGSKSCKQTVECGPAGTWICAASSSSTSACQP